MRGTVVAMVLAALVVACGRPPDQPVPSIGSPAESTCRSAFAEWVASAAALNSPGADLVAGLAGQDRVQRAVFERCSLAEAESLNRELQVEYVPGVRQPLIRPDMRTFAETECVDESPEFDGTRVCAEVGH